MDLISNNHNILFRCDGSKEIGLGHVVRCFALADELQKQNKESVITFAMLNSNLGIQIIENNYNILTEPETNSSFEYEKWLSKCIKTTKAKILILDVRDGLTTNYITKLKKLGILIITLDDPEEKRLSVDLAFYPPIPQVKKWSWNNFNGQLFSDWKYVILNRKFPSSNPKRTNSIPKILVSMGGTDIKGFTLLAIKSLIEIEESFFTTVLLGPGFSDHQKLNTLLANNKRFKTQLFSEDLDKLMSESDIAIASFGVTAYELAHIGVPSILLSLTEDHAESASIFADEEIGISIGYNHAVNKNSIKSAVKTLLSDVSRRKKMSRRAKKLIDGKGAYRIAKKIYSTYKNRK